MEIRTVRDLRFLLPSIDECDLTEVSVFTGRQLRYCQVGAVDWARLRLESAAIAGCKFAGTSMGEAVWEDVSITGTLFERSDLSSARLDRTKLDRVHFLGCQLSGLHLAEANLDNVIFENCRLDYGTFDAVRTTGPVAFVNCSLTEASLTACRLDRAVISDCRLAGVELDQCDLRAADLRGSSLETIRGTSSLRGVTITTDQLPDLTTALIADLELRIKSPT